MLAQLALYLFPAWTKQVTHNAHTNLNLLFISDEMYDITTDVETRSK